MDCRSVDTHMTSILLCGINVKIKNILINTVKHYCIQQQVHEWRVIIPRNEQLFKYYISHGFSQGDTIVRDKSIVAITFYYKFIYDQLGNCLNLI